MKRLYELQAIAMPTDEDQKRINDLKEKINDLKTQIEELSSQIESLQKQLTH